ncbi:MAG TPA: ferredoxin [Candidatus Merdenecus merdavium]|nr:ferredoxin [Candidatus Merdenecus merdavium]
MKAFVDPDLCIGCGLCPDVCGEVFEMGDDGLAHAIAEVSEENEGDAVEARDGCPVSAISLED